MAKEVKGIFISRRSLQDMGCLPPTWPPVKLVIKPDADLVCHTKPFRVPLHWKEQVKEGMERDVRLGSIEKLPPTPQQGVAIGWSSHPSQDPPS